MIYIEQILITVVRKLKKKKKSKIKNMSLCSVGIIVGHWQYLSDLTKISKIQTSQQ